MWRSPGERGRARRRALRAEHDGAREALHEARDAAEVVEHLDRPALGEQDAGLGEPAERLPVAAARRQVHARDEVVVPAGGLVALEGEVQPRDLGEGAERAGEQVGAVGELGGALEVLVGERELAEQHGDVGEGGEALDALGDAEVLLPEARGEPQGELGLVVLAVVQPDEAELQREGGAEADARRDRLGEVALDHRARDLEVLVGDDEVAEGPQCSAEVHVVTGPHLEGQTGVGVDGLGHAAEPRERRASRAGADRAVAGGEGEQDERPAAPLGLGSRADGLAQAGSLQGGYLRPGLLDGVERGPRVGGLELDPGRVG
jgi:hypothetical protein